SNNAIYTLQWAQSPSGPWSPIYFWTKDHSAAYLALTNETTAWVSTNLWRTARGFYQLVWANAPMPFRYTAYDLEGHTVVTGILSLVFYPNTNTVTGTWMLQRADNGTNYIGPQTGEGPLQGLQYPPILQLWWAPYWGTVQLYGKLEGLYQAGRPVITNYSGTWGVPCE